MSFKQSRIEPPVLFKRISLPEHCLTQQQADGIKWNFGGDVRIGDLTGDGRPDLLLYQSLEGGMKPCYLAALSMEGQLLWEQGSHGQQPARPGAVAVGDIDADDRAEVICFFKQTGVTSTWDRMDNVTIQIREGETGNVKKEVRSELLAKCTAEHRKWNWFHMRILMANFRGLETPRDFVVKVGRTVLAYDEELNPLWSYSIPWNDAGNCASYIPSVGDIDDDGCDEVNGGYFLLDQDGRVLWEKKLTQNMDSVAIAPWDGGRMRALCSGGGHVLDETGRIILKLEETIPHGQELRAAVFLPGRTDPQMLIRYNGHHPQVMLIDTDGTILSEFELNETPNNTGMEAIYWHGYDQPALVYNGGALWRADGKDCVDLPGLPPARCPQQRDVFGFNMGWYHCIPVGLRGRREGLLLYNPWDRYVFLYVPRSAMDVPDPLSGYIHTPRQYNARLMD